MSESRPNPLSAFSDETLVAFRCRGETWPRGRLVPDTWMGLLETPDGRRRYLPAGEAPAPHAADSLTFIRNRAIAVPLRLERAVAADSHAVDCDAELLVQWAAREDDLSALRRSLLPADRLTLSDLAQAVAGSRAMGALRALVHGASAAELVRGDHRERLLAALREGMKRWLFETGARLERVTRLRIVSPTFERSEALRLETARRLEHIEARRTLEQAAHTATQRRLSSLSTILAQLREAAAGDPDARWRSLLPALSPPDRARLLENLWRLTPDRRVAKAVAAICGDECLWIDPREPSALVHRATLPAELGPLRSVTFDEPRGWMLVGAARGVWAVSAGDGGVVRSWRRSGESPRRGFNACAIAGEHLLATHSQLGALIWPLDAESSVEPQALSGPARGAVAYSGQLWFLTGQALCRVHAVAGTSEVVAPLTTAPVALAIVDQTAFIGDQDGGLLRVSTDAPAEAVHLRRQAAPIESIAPRRWADLVELVIPGGAEGVLSVYEQEAITTPLLQPGLSIRRVWACDDLVVGLSDSRDRLVLLGSESADRSGAEAPLARLTGRTIQDACIITETAASPDVGALA